MTEAARTIVIGAGHNGLVCAASLARAGRRVLLLEATDRVGGAAVTREFHPGFRVSSVAHLAYALDPQVLRDLELARHGLGFARDSLRTVALVPGGEAIVVDGEHILRGAVAVGDREAFAALLRRLQRFAAVLARQHERVPPRLAFDGWRASLPALRLGLDLRRLGRDDLREFLRVVTMCVQDLLDESVETPALRGALALDAVLGTRLGPRSGGTVLTLLHRLSGGGRHALPRGGMGAVSAALERAATSAGVVMRTSCPVAAITVEDDRIAGVQLADGERIAADTIVAAIDPKRALLGLLGARHLEAEFARRVHHCRSTGTAAKLHLALSGAPSFRGVEAQDLGERLLVAPDTDYVDRAFNPAKYREASTEPVMEITIPSLHDASLAPPGQHVLSAIVQYAPHDLATGWPAARATFEARVRDVLERFAPGLRGLVLGSEFLTPVDLERDYGITGGHWHHGELALDQYLALRPVPGAAQYATPARGLWLASAGTHPGGGVRGTAGRLAAQAVLADGGAR